MITTVTLNTAVDCVAVLEALDWGGVNRSARCRMFPGGKGVNVAKAVAELGGEVVATGFVGAGPMGRFVVGGLRWFGFAHHPKALEGQRGAACDFLELPGDTRLTFLLYDLSRGQETVVNNPGAYRVAPGDLEALRGKLSDLAARSSFVVFSGSLAEGCPSDTYADLIRLVTEAGGRAVLDTSEEALRQGLAGRPYLLKPTVRELRMIGAAPLHDEDDILRAAHQLQQRGIEVVVVSRGGEGVLARFGEQAYKVPALPAEVVSPIGAGDALLGGLLVGLERGLVPPDALKLAVGAATSSLSRYGAALCRRPESESLAETVVVQPL